MRLFLICVLVLSACDGGGLPGGWAETPEGDGPLIRWELEAEPLPEIPLPNDVATWADPTSPSGFRLNASLFVPTEFERDAREHFDQLDGWSTFGPIMVQFETPIDTQALYDRQGGGTAAFTADRFQRHAVYLVDLQTGDPIPIDMNSGNFHYVVERPSQYFPNDPRAGESNTLFETVEEDLNGNGVLDPGEDTDFDGVLDHPNTFSRSVNDPLDTVDEMTWFYEHETNTLYMRPILPLRQNSKYAVVLTDRLVDERGNPVRSPFPHVHHVTQKDDLAALPELLAAHPDVYGDLAERGWEGIAFTWSFTTQSVTRDLDAIREGLYGRGVFSRLADDYPVDHVPHPMQGGIRGFECPDPGGGIFRAPGDAFRSALRTVAIEALELSDEQATEVIASYEDLDYIAVSIFDTPYFLGDPDDESLDDVWDVDYTTGRMRVGRETISAVHFIPKETPDNQQPFPVGFYVHGYGSANAEPIPWLGIMMNQGVAITVLNAQGHGVELDDVLLTVLENIFAEACIAPAGRGIIAGRARDLDGDGDIDSGRNFWTAWVFHTRDVVRQTIVDHVQAIRMLRSFDGERMAATRTLTLPGDREPTTFDGDYDRDGTVDLAGDFDGNGRPDLGGPDADYYMVGGSLGGIMSGILGGLEPAVTVTAPIVGAGGFADVAVRTNNGGVLRAMLLPIMGPLVVTVPSAGPDAQTTCPEGDLSLRFIVQDLNREARIEFACLRAEGMGPKDVMIVRNLSNGEVGCGGAVGGEPGRFRVAVDADAFDRLVVELYREASDDFEYGECHFTGPAPTPDENIETWRVQNGRRPMGDMCPDCARWQRTEFFLGDPLVSPTPGLAVRRQSPDVRRLLFFAQTGLEPSDPINYARRVFLEPVTAPDVRERTRSILIANTVGDNNVPLATANTYARAAGVLPFLPPDAPEELREWRAPSSFAARYPGTDRPTPNDALIDFHILEGVARMNRHPAGDGAEHYLADVDDLSEGRLRFDADGNQSDAPEAIGPVRADPPLRWFRQSRPMADGDTDVFSMRPGSPVSGIVNVYAVPEGIHGFEIDTVLNPSAPFDVAQYLINLIVRHATTNGADLHYITNPSGHHCLEDSSCDFLTTP